MKIERLEIINAGESDIIFACEKDFLPAELRTEPNATQCTVFYYPERDALVLNKNNPNYLRYKNLLINYLSFDNLERKEFHNLVDSMPISFFHSLIKFLGFKERELQYEKRKR